MALHSVHSIGEEDDADGDGFAASAGSDGNGGGRDDDGGDTTDDDDAGNDRFLSGRWSGFLATSRNAAAATEFVVAVPR